MKPSQESISAYFDGVTKNAHIIYVAQVGGFSMENMPSQEKYRLLCERFFKDLHTIILTDLKREDSIEISLELTNHQTVERLLAEFWYFQGLIGKDANIISQSERDEFLRPISDESVMCYFIGLSWLMKYDTPHREEKLLTFFKYVRDQMKLKIENEMIYDLVEFFESEKMVEWRIKAIDMMGVRHTLRGYREDG